MKWRDDVGTALKKDLAPKSYEEALLFGPGFQSTMVDEPGKAIKKDGKADLEIGRAASPDPFVQALEEVKRRLDDLNSRLSVVERLIEDAVNKKAALILGGPVKIPPEMELPFRPSCSTAGPGAGSTGIVLSFGGVRVKKAISRREGEFELVPKGAGRYLLQRDGRMFIDDLGIQPVVFHAPDQAFFNLDNRCILGCKFCAAPLLEEDREKGHTPEKVVEMILAAHREKDFDAVAITSSVPDTPEETAERMLEVVRGVRKALPTVTIGIEPYISSMDQIDAFQEAGANEIKLNIETFDPVIFAKVCGKKDYDLILRSIEHAVTVFGRGKVASNIIVGLGESDDCVLKGVDHLARMGCVATLRALRRNAYNETALTEELNGDEPVDQERLMKLALAQKEILEGHHLSTLTFRTMCHRCGCCDILPFVDLR